MIEDINKIINEMIQKAVKEEVKKQMNKMKKETKVNSKVDSREVNDIICRRSILNKAYKSSTNNLIFDISDLDTIPPVIPVVEKDDQIVLKDDILNRLECLCTWIPDDKWEEVIEAVTGCPSAADKINIDFITSSSDKSIETMIRERISNDVADKMDYMNTCLNTRNIILGIITGKISTTDSLCDECNNEDCTIKNDYKEESENEEGYWIHEVHLTKMNDPYSIYICGKCGKKYNYYQPYCGKCGSKNKTIRDSRTIINT